MKDVKIFTGDYLKQEVVDYKEKFIGKK